MALITTDLDQVSDEQIEDVITDPGFPNVFAPVEHTHDAGDVVSGQFTDDRIASMNASKLTGTIDVSRLPFIANNNTVVSSGGFNDLTGPQQTTIVEGTTVVLSNSLKYIYKGTGTKTDIASYIPLTESTVTWDEVLEKPITFPPEAHNQSADTITDGLTNKAYTATEKTKLAGIASGATANDTDANLKNRSNHTGTQAISTVAGLQTALDEKATSASVAVAIAAVLDAAPETLNTLKELATALGNDANYAATTSTALGNRLRVDVAQSLTSPQKAQAVSNLGLATIAVTGSVDALVEGTVNKLFTAAHKTKLDNLNLASDGLLTLTKLPVVAGEKLVPETRPVASGVALSTLVASGFYRLADTHPDLPVSSTFGNFSQLIVSRGGDTISQELMPYSGSSAGVPYFRTGYGIGGGSPVWTLWRRHIVQDSIRQSGDANLNSLEPGFYNMDNGSGVTGAPNTNPNWNVIQAGNGSRGFQIGTGYNDFGLWFRHGQDGWGGWQKVLTTAGGTVTGNLTVGNSSVGAWISSGGVIELTAVNPFIDFKNNGNDDFDARIILQVGGGTLDFEGVPVKFQQRPTWNGVGLATVSEAAAGGGGAGVSSFNGRTGAVAAASNDYTSAQISHSGSTVNDFLVNLSRKTVSIVTAEQFGAVGNGSTDDTTALQNALNTLNSSGGGVLLLANGKRYLISNLSLGSGHAAIAIQGVGAGSNNLNCATIVLTSGGTGNGIAFGDTTTGSSGIRLENFRLDGNGRNNGFAISLKREVGSECKNVRIVNCYNGIEAYGFNNIQFEDCVIASGTGLHGWYLWGDDVNRFNVATLYSCGVSQAGTKTMSAYTIDGAGGTITLIDSIAVNCAYGLRSQNTKGTADGVSFIWTYAFQTDFSLNDGIRLENVKGVYMISTYAHGSESGRGITALADCMALQITGGKITGNYNDGLYFAGQDMTVGGGVGIEGNGQIGSNLRDGIVVAATAKNVLINGCKLGRYANLASSQRYGVLISSGATSVLVTGNDLTGNLSGGVANNAGSNATIATNLT